MSALDKVEQLGRLADLRLSASEKRLFVARKAEHAAAQLLTNARRALETYHMRLPHKRAQVMRELGSGALSRAGVETLREALMALEKQIDELEAEITTAQENLKQRRDKCRECQKEHVRLTLAQRRRRVMTKRMRDAALQELERREEGDMDEWRRTCVD